jgi:hypothetical protein
MRLLTYTICVLAGLAASVVVVALIAGWNEPPEPAPSPPLVTQPVAAIATAPPSPRKLKPPPWEVPPEPPKFLDLDGDGLTRLLGGPEVVAVVQRADRVTSVLLQVPPNVTIPPRSTKEATPEVDLDADTAARVTSALFDPKRNRQREGAKGCAPRWGWRVSYYAGARRVDFYFCLECAMLVVYLDGDSAGGAQIDFVNEELKAILDSIAHGTADRPSEPPPAPIPVPGVP